MESRGLRGATPWYREVWIGINELRALIMPDDNAENANCTFGMVCVVIDYVPFHYYFAQFCRWPQKQKTKKGYSVEAQLSVIGDAARAQHIGAAGVRGKKRNACR